MNEKENNTTEHSQTEGQNNHRTPLCKVDIF